MRRRSKNSTPMSLFSFQDIITAITGILILLGLGACALSDYPRRTGSSRGDQGGQ